jgi:hypothetical protein
MSMLKKNQKPATLRPTSASLLGSNPIEAFGFRVRAAKLGLDK